MLMLSRRYSRGGEKTADSWKLSFLIACFDAYNILSFYLEEKLARRYYWLFAKRSFGAFQVRLFCGTTCHQKTPFCWRLHELLPSVSATPRYGLNH